ncbi:MAG: trypsin-like peptidase domain-containing protein [Candidatus Taylorbacteria bacterium]|nr:trypsin-like peptidase domain-containing protein [Candidatus Taylorbacteria bacterium]
MDKPLRYSIISLVIIGAAALGGRALYTAATGFIAAEEKKFDDKILVLQKQIAAISEAVQKITGENIKTALSLKEIQNRQNVRAKTQDELLTDAVGKVTPAVVSVVISKDVPELEVVYQNPFGDDPFFKNFNIQVPVYRQKGVKNQKVGGGSGFLITADGHILTNRHVVLDTAATYSVLLADGKQKPAKVIYKDADKDIAIIKIDGAGYKTVALGDSDKVLLGESVIAIGNALGEYSNSVSVGIISGLNRELDVTDPNTGKPEKLSGIFQTDTAINLGNSGGPLINMQGQAIGINVATVLGSQNVSFSIPLNSVKSILKRELDI